MEPRGSMAKGAAARADLPDFDERMEAVVALLAAQADAARRDPYAFYEFVMREETTGAPLRIADHQRLMIDFMLAHQKCVIRGFAGCGKTYVVAAVNLFEMGLDPTERGVIASATQTQSKKPMSLVRRYVEESDELHLVFPDLVPSPRRGDPWTQTQLTIKRDAVIIRDPTLTAVHEGAKLPGSRLSRFNADDLLTLDNTASEAQRDYTWDWMQNTALSRLDADGARTLVTNTPYQPDDLTFRLEQGYRGTEPWPTLTLDAEGDVTIRNAPHWDSDLIRPALTKDPEGVRHRLVRHDDPAYARLVGIDTEDASFVDERDRIPLWPERWGWPQLEEQKRTMTTLDYNRTKRCLASDPASQHIKQEHIDLCKAMAARFGVFETVLNWRGDDAFTGVDPAFGLNPKNDQTALFSFALLPSGYRRILQVKVDRWPSDVYVGLIVTTAADLGSVVCVEGNGAQRIVRDWAAKERKDILVRARDTTHKNKTDPKFGIASLILEVQQGLWLIPHDPRTGKVTDPGVLAFVKGCFDYRPGAHVPDVLMAAWIAREQARRMGLLEDPGPMPPGGVPSLAAIRAR